MKTMLFAAAATTALALSAAPAAAADWYAQVNAGYSVQSDAEADLSVTYVDEDDETITEEGSIEGEIDNGFVVGAAGGVSLGSGLRVELEGLLNNHEVSAGDDLTEEEQAVLDELGFDSIDVSHAAAFVNVLYDFQMGAVTPYVGAGIGFGSLTLEVDGESIHDEDTVWQLRAGVSYPVSDTLTLDFGYRYINMATFETTFEDVVLDDSVDPDLTGDLGFGFEPTTHILSVGARFKLG